MPAISFNEALASIRTKVGKKHFTGDELRKAMGTPAPFTKSYTKDDPPNESPDSFFTHFDEAVNWIMQRDGVSRTAAMSTARKEYPHLVNKLQAETDDIIQKAEQDEADDDDRRFAAKAIQRPFLAKVEAIRTRDGLSHTEAMTKARIECPQEFQEAFGHD